jgi:hypothetical protein
MHVPKKTTVTVQTGSGTSTIPLNPTVPDIHNDVVEDVNSLDFEERAFENYVKKLQYVRDGEVEVVEHFEDKEVEFEAGVIRNQEDADKVASGDGEELERKTYIKKIEGYTITKEVYTSWEDDAPVIIAFRNRPEKGKVRMFFTPKVEFEDDKAD